MGARTSLYCLYWANIWIFRGITMTRADNGLAWDNWCRCFRPFKNMPCIDRDCQSSSAPIATEVTIVEASAAYWSHVNVVNITHYGYKYGWCAISEKIFIIIIKVYFNNAFLWGFHLPTDITINKSKENTSNVSKCFHLWSYKGV